MDISPFLRLATKRRFATLQNMDVVEAQEKVLLNLTRRAKHTKFGRDHGFPHIKTVADFQRQVPVRQFEDLWAEYWQKPWPILDNVTWPGQIPFYAKTSGTTTGRTKHIPITKESIKSNERAGFDLMTFHMHHYPSSRPLAGRSFIIAGSTTLEEVAPNIFSGYVSGINTKLTPFWVKPNIFPPKDLALISNWDEKLDVIGRKVLDERITMVSGSCNWVLFMLDHIRALRKEKGLGDGPTFPELQLFIHAGVPIDIYRNRLDPHFPQSGIDKREMYPASEGFIAVADRGPGEGMRVMVDNNLFFEFIPLEDVGSHNPRRHWMANIEKDVDYAIVVSNCAGLWAYLLGDVVRFVETRPPRLHILGRVSQTLNPFGEHLIGAELENAVQSAAHRFGVEVAEYTVGPILPEAVGETGCHVYIIEPISAIGKKSKVLSSQFSQHIDNVLLTNNEDYEGVRKGHAISPPQVVWVQQGTFEKWMRSQGKMGGQHKVPRVTAKGDRFTQLRQQLGVLPEHFVKDHTHEPTVRLS